MPRRRNLNRGTLRKPIPGSHLFFGECGFRRAGAGPWQGAHEDQTPQASVRMASRVPRPILVGGGAQVCACGARLVPLGALMRAWVGAEFRSVLSFSQRNPDRS